MKNYNLIKGSMQWKFHNSQAKIRLIGGGFGNGKTTALVIEALMVAEAYPGADILLARSTYPKLNDTLRKECLKWCPKEWVKRKPTKDDNTLILKNGTHIKFRYVSQQGKSSDSGATTSNLLSATFDFIGVDQVEDPEISYKDFTDLLGRLRGDTNRRPDANSSWPADGPRWLVLTCNPTRNWVFRKLVRPVQIYKASGVRHPDLIVDPQTHEPLLEIFEAATYENKNLAKDFITGLEASYKGQMRARFLEGKWAAYEGLVYPQYDLLIHSAPRDNILTYLKQCVQNGIRLNVIEGYDFGLSSASCYGFAIVDYRGNVFLIDGMYEKECPIATQAFKINAIRRKYEAYAQVKEPILADPAIFKRSAGGGKIVGRSVASMFSEDFRIRMRKGNNDIINGIAKVQAFLEPDPMTKHPITENFGAPKLYHAEELEWFGDEISDYYWTKKAGDDELPVDKPMDRNDHAMDMLKYMLSFTPAPAVYVREEHNVSGIPMTWEEVQSQQNHKAHRYG